MGSFSIMEPYLLRGADILYSNILAYIDIYAAPNRKCVYEMANFEKSPYFY